MLSQLIINREVEENRKYESLLYEQKYIFIPRIEHLVDRCFEYLRKLGYRGNNKKFLEILETSKDGLYFYFNIFDFLYNPFQYTHDSINSTFSDSDWKYVVNWKYKTEEKLECRLKENEPYYTYYNCICQIGSLVSMLYHRFSRISEKARNRGEGKYKLTNNDIMKTIKYIVYFLESISPLHFELERIDLDKEYYNKVLSTQECRDRNDQLWSMTLDFNM